MAIKDWNGFKKNGDSYIPNDATARTRIGTLSSLLTTAKDNLVAAINELVNNLKTKVSWSDAKGYVRKNKLIPTGVLTYTENGITFTLNSDGSVTVNGTATARADYTYSVFKADGKTNVISGAPANGTGKWNVRIDLTASGETNQCYDDGVSGASYTKMSTAAGTEVKCVIRVYTGNTFNNVKFYPMLRDASIADDTYEPYIPDNTELFPRSEQAVLGAKNIWDDNIALSSNASATVTKTTDGYAVQTNTTANSGGQFNQTPLRTRYTPFGNITVSFEYKSDIACAGYIGKSDVTLATDWTKVSYSVDGSTMGAICFYNRDTTKTPLIEMRNMMITLATDTDPSFVPPAMTNRELTDRSYSDSINLTLTNPITEWTAAGTKAACKELYEYMLNHNLSVMNVSDGTYDYTCDRIPSERLFLNCYRGDMSQRREVNYNRSTDTALVVVTNLTPVS